MFYFFVRIDIELIPHPTVNPHFLPAGILPTFITSSWSFKFVGANL